MYPEYFEARERALLGERFDALFSASEAPARGLTVNGLLDTSAAVGALELYAQAQNVTLQNSFETETADLVILDAPPQDDGTWKNLAENELLAAAAQRGYGKHRHRPAGGPEPVCLLGG